MGRSPDVVVVGAGVVGASCAFYLASAGIRVRLYDRSFIASGSSGSCEGNVLAWDKELERELPLALRSADLWQGLSSELDDDFEYDRKGSVVVAETEAELRACAERNRVLAGLGVEGEVLDAGALAPRGALRRARPPGRRAVSRRRPARAAPGDVRAGPRRGRARGGAVHRRRGEGDRPRRRRARHGRRDERGLRRRGPGRGRRGRVDARSCSRPRGCRSRSGPARARSSCSSARRWCSAAS